MLASGHGTNLQALIDSSQSKILKGKVTLVISDHGDSGAVERSRRHGIPVHIIGFKGDLNAFFSRIALSIKSASPDLVVLAGFMRIIPGEVVRELGVPIINVHPSLLPCFGGKGMYGSHVHRSVIESGTKYSGCTVHFVTPEVDSGPIIVQKVIQISDDDTPDTLAEKIHPLEHEALIEAVNIVLSGDYKIKGKRVIADKV